MKYKIKLTSSFKKDLKAAKRQHKDLDKLFKVVNMLASGEKLDETYDDHPLHGKYKGSRECHIEPDWLLIYQIRNDILVLSLYHLGSHSHVL